MRLNNNITIFIDLFLIAFISIMIVNALSPKEKELDELKLIVSFSTPNSNIRIDPILYIQIDDEIYDFETESKRIKWSINNNSIGASFTYPKDASKLVLDVFIRDDYGTLKKDVIKYYLSSSNGMVNDGELERENYYHETIEIF